MDNVLEIVGLGKAPRNTTVTIRESYVNPDDAGILLRLENSSGDVCSIGIGKEDADALVSAILMFMARY